MDIVKQPTVNSLSGGRTSSYLAVHYPADIDVFALVVADCHNSNPRFTRDKKLVQLVNDKIQKHSIIKDRVVSTPEDVNTIKVVLNLEQKIGREIRWVRDISFEEMMNQKKAIPNIKMRFCSFMLKIKPIFEYLMVQGHSYVDMRIGYRYGEENRMKEFTTDIKYVDSVNLYGAGKNNWRTVTWRKGSFPLIEDRIIYPIIIKYWKDFPEFEFPEDSNCQMCFWKAHQQLRKNFDTNFNIMMWAAIQEKIRGRRFKKDMSLLQISKIGVQESFVFGTGSGCGSGMCTN